MGDGRLIDIEREAKLSGSSHTKGVMILANFLADRFAAERPLSLTASLVFEQSYGPIDGDSASMAELCALMTTLAGVPIRQSLAMTGSVNQHGRAQAIGGVNEKIEGFFDVCRAKGLTGDQGVLIPDANVVHLMLRPEVRDACKRGAFTIYAYQSVDQALELLTGLPAGTRASSGEWTAGSINQRVDARLAQFEDLRRQHGKPLGQTSPSDSSDVEESDDGAGT
jgi:predicted ATP-dependent protease